MGLIDVSELLSDPDFVDEMTMVTRVPSIDSLGENRFTETSVVSVGSVQPATGRTISKLPELFRVANVSSFWFKGEIVASAPGKYSSILIFRGRRYQVQLVFDWLNWGEGWCEGTCVAELPS